LGLCALAAARPAEAGLILRLDTGPSTIIVNDNLAGDLNPAVGQITSVGNIGDFSSTINVGQSNSPGTTFGMLQIQSLDIRNAGVGQRTLKVTLSDTGFTAPDDDFNPLQFSSSFGGTLTNAAAGDLVAFQSFADPANAQPATAVPSGLGAYGSAGGNITESFNATNGTTFVRAASPYSLASVTTITLSPSAQVSVSGTTVVDSSVVPEPAAVGSLVGVALLGLARRRRTAR